MLLQRTLRREEYMPRSRPTARRDHEQKVIGDYMQKAEATWDCKQEEMAEDCKEEEVTQSRKQEEAIKD